jgi:nucleotide-binding universal stress UspA family protein
MFENVVVGVRDNQTGRDAVALANQLISTAASITLVHVHVVASKPSPDSAASADAAKRQAGEERLAALASEFSVDAQVSWTEARSVRRGLHEVASSRNADLLVVRATSADELARAFVADDTRDVLEDAPCVVAVAPAGYSADVAGISKIGVAYDGSAGSEQALALARQLAADRDAQLSAFEAVPTPLYIHDPWNAEEEDEERVEEARRRIAALGGVEPAAASGDAVDALAKYSESVDLLVMGGHRYRRAEHLSDGSKSQLLVDSASSPLLVLPAASRVARTAT